MHVRQVCVSTYTHSYAAAHMIRLYTFYNSYTGHIRFHIRTTTNIRVQVRKAVLDLAGEGLVRQTTLG